LGSFNQLKAIKKRLNSQKEDKTSYINCNVTNSSLGLQSDIYPAKFGLPVSIMSVGSIKSLNRFR
jgi:hypothetical protein